MQSIKSKINGLATIKCSDINTYKKDAKESVKRHLRRVMETTKKHSTELSLKMKPPYL